MASPTPDTYSAAPGAVLRAGFASAPPDWLAAPGTIADLTLNTVAQAGEYRSRIDMVWRAWSGVAWAPWWGKYGSMIATGGGHSDGSYNDVYRIDVETRLCSMIKPASTIIAYKANNYIAPESTGLMWANSIEGDLSTQDGEPFAAHHYSGLVALPPGSIPDMDAPNGILYTAGRKAMPYDGSLGTAQAHALAMGTSIKWQLHGSGATQYAEFGGAAHDTRRGRVWHHRSTDSTGEYWRDLATGVQSGVNFSGTSYTGYERVMEYSAVHDLILTMRLIPGVSPLILLDPATNQIITPTLIGDAPNPSTHGWGASCWSDAWGAAIFYKGSGNTLYSLKPTGNPRTEPWEWRAHTFVGTAYPYVSAGGTPYNRLRHASKLGNVLIWAADTYSKIQQIHLAEAP